MSRALLLLQGATSKGSGGQVILGGARPCQLVLEARVTTQSGVTLLRKREEPFNLSEARFCGLENLCYG